MDLKGAMQHVRKTMDPIFGKVFIYEHCLPFDVSRAFDEARGIENPRIWTAQRDREMWAALQDLTQPPSPGPHASRSLLAPGQTRHMRREVARHRRQHRYLLDHLANRFAASF